MTIAENIDEYRKAAKYVSLKRLLNPVAIPAIIFGALALTGLTEVENLSATDIFTIVVGIMLVLEGILILSIPNPLLLIFTGITVVFVAALNIYPNLQSIGSESGGFDILWMMLGFVQLSIAYNIFASYKHFKKMPEKPSIETLKQLEFMTNNLNKASSKTAFNIIELTIKEGAIYSKWKVKLLDNFGLFLRKGFRQDIIIASNDEIIFKPQAGNVQKNKLNMVFEISERKMFGTISQKHFNKYTIWKGKQENPHGLVEIPEE